MSDTIIFTDLDETLLERVTFAFEPAHETLVRLRERGTPVVFCTSKTRTETEHFRQATGNSHPFIVENGGGIYLPKGYFNETPPDAQETGSYLRIAMGEEYGRILDGMKCLKSKTQNSILGFNDLSPEEVAADTGLSVELARFAKMREFDEPFKFIRREAEFCSQIQDWTNEIRLQLTQGGRYYHLHGEFDKGQAVRRLIRMYRKRFGRIETIGLGDSPNDLQMLLQVDHPVAVAHADGSHDTRLCTALPRLLKIADSGPRGWARGILQLVG